jgi:hypothetical protein
MSCFASDVEGVGEGCSIVQGWRGLLRDCDGVFVLDVLRSSRRAVSIAPSARRGLDSSIDTRQLLSCKCGVGVYNSGGVAPLRNDCFADWLIWSVRGHGSTALGVI